MAGGLCRDIDKMSNRQSALKKHSGDRMMRYGRRAVIALPYIWLGLFFLVPFLIVLKISFATGTYAQQPYSNLIHQADETVQIRLDFGNYLFLLKKK